MLMVFKKVNSTSTDFYFGDLFYLTFWIFIYVLCLTDYKYKMQQKEVCVFFFLNKQEKK